MNRSSPLTAEGVHEEKHVWQRYPGREDVSFQPGYHDNLRSDVVNGSILAKSGRYVFSCRRDGIIARTPLFAAVEG